MASRDPIHKLIKERGTLIIDGALATELEARGCDLKDSLWSARILISKPHLIQQVHHDYFLAGADIAITASYQASAIGLKAACGLSEQESCDLIAKSVRLAHQARTQVLELQPERSMLVAGSVGPYGAYLADGSEYRGDYSLSDREMKDFHRPRIRALVEAGADLLACETIPSFAETEALLGLLQDEFSESFAWFSFTLKDEAHISDGTSLEDVCRALNASSQVVAIGVNCVPQSLVGPALRHLKTLTSKPLLAYPNSGEVYDAEAKIWHSASDIGPGMARMVNQWVEAGAVLVGGCCRTGPSDIQTISKILRTAN